MSDEATEKKSSLVELSQAIGAVLGVPIVFFTIINNIFQQPIVSLSIAIITGIGLSIWLASSRKMNYAYLAIAWLALFVIILLGFVVWPNTMTLEGFVTHANGKPVVNETVTFFDYRGQIYETQTDQGGFYQFVDVPTGKYRIRVRATEIQGESKGLLVRVVSQSISVSSEVADSPTPTPTHTATLQEIADDPTSTPTGTVVPQEVTNTPTPTPTKTPSSTPNVVQPDIGTVLFTEDFEDGKAQFIDGDGNWEVVVDETGNSVYSINASTTGFFPTASFGKNEWEDYVVECRVKFLELKGRTVAYIAFRVSGTKKYELALEPIYNKTEIAYWHGQSETWDVLDENHLSVDVREWYSVRIEVKGTEIKAYIDDNLISTVTDTRINKGELNLIIGSDTHAHFDDIVVTAL